MKGRVARHQADRTNQKLYFTRVYCQLAEQCEDAQLNQAHIESAITHLYGTYLAFLQELSSFYGLSLNEPTLQSIESTLDTKTQISPEIQRLKNAMQTDFLGEIYQAWQQVLYKPLPIVADKAPTHAVEIPMIDVMATKQSIINSQVSSELVRHWRTELLSLIESLREGMIEY